MKAARRKSVFFTCSKSRAIHEAGGATCESESDVQPPVHDPDHPRFFPAGAGIPVVDRRVRGNSVDFGCPRRRAPPAGARSPSRHRPPPACGRTPPPFRRRGRRRAGPSAGALRTRPPPPRRSANLRRELLRIRRSVSAKATAVRTFARMRFASTSGTSSVANGRAKSNVGSWAAARFRHSGQAARCSRRIRRCGAGSASRGGSRSKLAHADDRRRSRSCERPPAQELGEETADLLAEDPAGVEEVVADGRLAASQDLGDLASSRSPASRGGRTRPSAFRRAGPRRSRRAARARRPRRRAWRPRPMDSSRSRTRWSVAPWARSRLRELRRKSIARFVAIR